MMVLPDKAVIDRIWNQFATNMDQVFFGRQQEWGGVFTIDRFKGRELAKEVGRRMFDDLVMEFCGAEEGPMSDAEIDRAVDYVREKVRGTDREMKPTHDERITDLESRGEVMREPKIKRNRCQCRDCGDIIESRHRHDFVRCRCGVCFTDGGLDYIRRGFSGEPPIDLDEYEEATDA